MLFISHRSHRSEEDTENGGLSPRRICVQKKIRLRVIDFKNCALEPHWPPALVGRSNNKLRKAIEDQNKLLKKQNETNGCEESRGKINTETHESQPDFLANDFLPKSTYHFEIQRESKK
ncbi:hypothetical protein TNCV_4944671 [Trichonephila clavipes]|nr:hypothetical protein TNCV_4944671 [Trichonephila clavipes]